MADDAVVSPKGVGGIKFPPVEVLEVSPENAPKDNPEAGPNRPDLALMLDIESLDVGPRSVVTQIALVAMDLEEDEMMDFSVHSYLPIQPQLDLMQPRTISASTLWWWMQQPTEARAAFEFSLSDDFHELPVLMKHFVSQFDRVTRGKTYRLWARGPQFDVVNVESLLKDCGVNAPWGYSTVADLRTLMAEAGLSTSDVPKPKGFIAHNALWDCKYQLLCLREAQKRLHRRG